MQLVFGGSSTKNVVASRATSSICIDGLLNDDAWRSAVPVAGFRQFDPEEGSPATEETIVSILYDDDALYVGVMCYDSNPGGIVGQLNRRDRSTQADKFTIFVDSYHDHSTAFMFGGSVSGVQTDALLSQDGRVYDVQWDAVWDFDAKLLPNGWSGEFRVPYSAIRFAGQDSGEYTWGINFRRFIARKKELDDWALATRQETPQGSAMPISKFGHLSGIRDIQPPLHVELLPYQVSKVNSLSKPEPFTRLNEFSGTAGLDLKYGVTNNFTFDLALNPDFGQVEVDQAVLNLTVFETFYPEKRPFFLEGSQIFTFGNMFDNRPLRLLYSRRIGRQPSGYETISRVDSFNVDSNAVFWDKPELTRILAAGKISGSTGDGLEIGVLSAVTDQVDAVLKDLNGNRSRPVTVEPRASYNAVRLRQSLGNSSWLGVMGTSMFRDRGFPALSGGTDWNYQFGEDNYCASGYLAGSYLTPSPGIQQTGGAGRIGFAKLSGEHWLAFSTYEFSTWNFDINDVGFYSQPRDHGGYVQLSYKENYATEPVRRYALTLGSDARWNWNGVNTLEQLEFEPDIEFRNFWVLSIDYLHYFPAFDDENKLSYIGYIPSVSLYNRPAGDEVKLTLQTDSRKPVFLTLSSGYKATTRGMSSVNALFQFTLRPDSWVELSPGFMLARSRSEEAWPVGYYTSNGLSLFGDRDVDQYYFFMRGILTFTRHLSLQFFTQVFLANYQYVNYRELITPNDLVPYAFPYSLEYNVKVLDANVVLRWEYLPGSTFYLVWTQARSGYGSRYDVDIRDNVADTFRLPMDNVLLAKISYWWSL